MTTIEPPERPVETVQSLERGLAVIRAFDAEHPRMSLSDVARATGLTRAAARRFLHTLVALGYMRTDGRLFALRPTVLELGYAYLSSLSLPEVAQPHLEDLVGRVHESTSISVLDADEIVYVARVATKRIMTMAISVGTRFPAHATSMGRVMLAARSDDWLNGYLASARLRPITPNTVTDARRLMEELYAVRRQGWSMVDQELEEGLRAAAVPIIDGTGQVIAALNISVQAQRWTAQAVESELLPALFKTAGAINADLRAAGSPNT